MLISASAVKPGDRFSDEISAISYSLQDYSVRLLGNKAEVMKVFDDPKKAKASKDEDAAKPIVKSTFKIEISEEEMKVRESAQSIYHTG